MYNINVYLCIKFFIFKNIWKKKKEKKNRNVVLVWGKIEFLKVELINKILWVRIGERKGMFIGIFVF